MKRSGNPIMDIFETSATVEPQGRIFVAGVPFAPGTEVEVTISAKPCSQQGVVPPDEAALTSARLHMQELFQTIKGFRIGQRIPREELHDRGRVRRHQCAAVFD